MEVFDPHRVSRVRPRVRGVSLASPLAGVLGVAGVDGVDGVDGVLGSWVSLWGLGSVVGVCRDKGLGGRGPFDPRQGPGSGVSCLTCRPRMAAAGGTEGGQMGGEWGRIDPGNPRQPNVDPRRSRTFGSPIGRRNCT